MPKTWSLIVAGLVLAALAIFTLLKGSRAVLVETANVVAEPFEAVIEEDGRTRVRDRFIVSAPLAGRTPRFPLRTGDVVNAGETLTNISPHISPLLEPRVRQELEEKVGTALAAVEEFTALKEQNEVLLQRLRIDLDRTTKLREPGVASIAQFDRDTFAVLAAEREVSAAERRRHAAEHILEQARAALKRSGEDSTGEDFPVTSPINGRVLRIIQESESVVALGAPLVELGDTTDLEVMIDVLTSDAASIKAGDKMILDRWGGPNPLVARVRRVDPSGFTKISALGVEEQRVWVIGDIVSPKNEWTALGDGYRVDARIIVETMDKAIVIPVGALFRRGDNWYVFALVEGTAQLRQVHVVRRSGRRAAIASGLEPGERVVIYPPNALTDGSTVRVQ
jgi:HlyD family secretion protein